MAGLPRRRNRQTRPEGSGANGGGRDPREYALVAFGGNGPLFAVAMAQALQIRRVLIPPSAGVFSSYGLLYSEVAYHFTRSRKALLGAVDPAEIDAILRELETHARTALPEDGFTQEQIALERAAALHYQGQSFELEVPVPPGAIDRATLAALEEVYGAELARRGHPVKTVGDLEGPCSVEIICRDAATGMLLAGSDPR